MLYRWGGLLPVSLEHFRRVDPQTRIVVGYRLDVTPAESPRLRRRLALPPDPRIALHFDEVVFPDTPGRFWGAMLGTRCRMTARGRSGQEATGPNSTEHPTEPRSQIRMDARPSRCCTGYLMTR
jgi:hypothetical protein